MIDPELAFSISDSMFTEAILGIHRRLGRPVLIGLCGAQGSGKSTSVRRLATRLENQGLRVLTCSLDDFYLTKSERRSLSKTVHPLLETRGVPGTHDVPLMENIVAAVLNATPATITAVPLFDKASDDRLPFDAWHQYQNSADVLLLEGWCIGARPQPDAALRDPVNTLERDEDPDGRWRRFVNAKLAGEYAAFFACFDLILMLRAPSFDCVRGWRAEQEAGLDRTAPGARPPLSMVELERFIAHYERITRWLILDEPASLIADLNENRVPIAWRWKTNPLPLRS